MLELLVRSSADAVDRSHSSDKLAVGGMALRCRPNLRARWPLTGFRSKKLIGAIVRYCFWPLVGSIWSSCRNPLLLLEGCRLKVVGEPKHWKAQGAGTDLPAGGRPSAGLHRAVCGRNLPHSYPTVQEMSTQNWGLSSLYGAHSYPSRLSTTMGGAQQQVTQFVEMSLEPQCLAGHGA